MTTARMTTARMTTARIRSRRTSAAVLALALTGGALGLAPQAVLGAASAAPAAKATITSVDAVVGSDRTIRVGVKCSVAKCTGTVSVKVSGVGTVKKTYKLAKGKKATVALKLSAAQTKKVAAAPKAGTVTVTRKVGKTTKKVTRKVEVKAAAPSLLLTSTTVTVGHDHVVAVALTCKATSTCTATASLTVAGKGGSGTQAVRLAKGATKTLRFALTPAQVAALGDGSAKVTGALRIVETAPEKVTSTQTVALLLDHEMDTEHGTGTGTGGDEHTGHENTMALDDTYSQAYLKVWKPTAYDTCTTAEHQSYSVTGVDGKLYPSWHPAVHTRADGSICTFGHEHGDDPRNSDIYDWVVSEYKKQNPDANGVPFGYGSEQLTVYSNIHNSVFHRHEDDPGHKVIVANNQLMGVKFTDRWGDTQEMECDTLIKAHQGSHSSDATKNNTHELVYALSCNDGTKVLTTVMTNYGNANELTSSCTRPFATEHTSSGTVIETKGSILPAGEGGARYIPTLDCINAYVKNGAESGTPGSAVDDRRGSPAASSNGWWWAGYEQWQSFSTLKMADGKEIARFEPWFGLQNPARYYTGNTETNTSVAYLNDLAWENGNQQNWGPWKDQRAASPSEPVDEFSPKSWFKGDIRDAWLTTTKVDNRDAASSVIWTNPWGKEGSTTAFTGSIRTIVSRTSNVEYVKTTTPTVANRSTRTSEGLTRQGASAPLTMNFFYDYGRDVRGNSLGVHAPN
ncbi:hypothetical protein [Nocardioides yefusunii]|uniref:Uncharacterized protein n=1 Tax=Nocardioides yefusunii TaxID=2500546 RepID=A0ABW1QX87_9ACTN|nr:hypothetical protein [Nocardioides yefusunii]